MKLLAFLLCSFWFIDLQLVFLFSFNLLLRVQPSRTASAFGNETDHLALIKFKESIFNDPYDIFASWNSSTHFCNWAGISCGHRHRQRVTRLELQGCALHGIISPHVGNLSFLRSLNLLNNSFSGIIPQELGHLFRLQQLWLTNNTLVGEIPSNLTSCFELRSLRLHGNRLVGQIPTEIGALYKLQLLSLGKNNLSGQFPASLWNLSSLNALEAGQNNLKGKIPEEIGRLNLKYLEINDNQLFGMLPFSLSNISSLIGITITKNKFEGSLPSNMFHHLPNLQYFFAGGNQLSGLIPNSIINASNVFGEFDVAGNNFWGQVPNLGMLRNLSWLGLSQNNLGNNSPKDLEFMKSLINCTKLRVLTMDANNFGGALLDFVSNFSDQFNELYLGDNHVYGNIPETLGKLINLVVLALEGNNVTGEIPNAFGRFQKMQLLSLTGNKVSGKIPTSIGNLSQLFRLELSKNMLEGNIPPSIGNCKNLQIMDLSQNNLRGVIPSEVIGLSSLSIRLNLSQNSLSGNLPSEVRRLTNIGTLDVSRNHLVGHIPETIGDCKSLEYLNLQGNLFNGNIPSSLTFLKGLQHLDLSRNNLSGAIPKLLQNISALQYLNVSFNMLDGEVPKEGVFHNASQLSVVGNDKLCGGILELHLPPCLNKVKKSKHHLIMIIVIIFVVGSFLLLLSLLCGHWMRRRRRTSSSTSSLGDQFSKVSYQSLHHATNAFSTSNLIGLGSYGSVYKGRLESENSIVAIKVFNLEKIGAHKSFISECNALKSIRHRNLVKILTCCSSLDYKGVEFKALVFEYMKNGSLEQWLHLRRESEDRLRTLDLNQRLNILIDIACAIHYLHYECEQPVIHCDLKPSNILLDDDMVAHVSDFGLARILLTINDKQTSTSRVKGTIGYAPPEYGMNFELSTQGDLYSFGILIMEMLTGKRPTDEMFKDDQNLHNYVKKAFPNNFMQILDPFLVQREGDREYENMEGFPMIQPNEEKCLISLFEMGLACSMESPNERMNMVEVSRGLNQIKKAF